MKFKIPSQQVLYTIAFCIFSFGEIWQLDNSTSLYKLLATIAGFLILWKIYLQKNTIKDYVVMVVFMSIMLVCLLNSGAITTVISMLFIIACKDVNLEKLLKWNLVLRVITYITIIVLSLFNIRTNAIIHISRMTGQEATRYSLGFEHPNQLHMHFFIIVILFLVVFYRELRVYHYLEISVLNILLYIFSVSRTGILATFGALILTIVFKYFEKKEFKLPMIIALAVPVFTLFSIISSIFYSTSGILNIINKLLQGRISNSQYYWKLNGVSFWGQELTSNNSDLILDNSYVILWLNFGILILILFNLGYTLSLINLIKKNQYSSVLMIVLFAIYGITEGFLSNIFLNISLLHLSTLFFDKELISNYKRILKQQGYKIIKRGMI